MENLAETKKNGCGDSAALRDELKSALMKLPADKRYELLKDYAEKYGIKLFVNLT